MKKSLFLIAAASLIFMATGCEEPEPEPNPSEQPSIEVTNAPGNQLTFVGDGGTGSIEYTISNPIDGGTVKAEANQTWVDAINYETTGTVTFNILENEETESRNAILTITYTWADGEASAQINIIQSGRTVFFDIQVPEDEVKATSARVIVSCLDETISYYYDGVATSAIIAENPDFAEAARQDLLALAEIYAMFGYSLTDFLIPGNTTDDYTWTGLSSNTAYTPYAFGIDENGEFTTEIHYGPEFTTTEIQMVDLTFEFDYTPSARSVVYDIIPSDKSAYYYTTVIDESWYDAGYDDMAIIAEITNNYSSYLEYYALQGDYAGYNVTGMSPETKYYITAWGIDMDQLTYNSEMTKQEFYTTANQPTDAFAEGNVNYYWHSDDLVAYNPEYENYVGSKPLFAALDMTYNETAAGCYYVVWTGDITADQTEEEIYNNTLANGDEASSTDPNPANIYYMAYDEYSTICVIAFDAEGNTGDMYMKVFQLTEEGTSQDYALFDEYFNTLMGGSSASFAIKNQMEIPERPAFTPEVSSLPTDRIVKRPLR